MKSDPPTKAADASVKRLLLEGSGREDLVVRALQECQQAIDAGQPIDRARLLEKYSKIHAELSACLDGLELMQPSTSGDNDQVAAAIHQSTVRPRAMLGDFRIVREIGRGGMGVVYEAEQLSVGRKVALKVLPYAAMLDQKQIARFQNESRAAATLEHPHIVPVYFVGSERGVYYYAMRLIDGQDLSEVLAELRGSTEDVANRAASLGRIASSLAGGSTSGRSQLGSGGQDIPAQPSGNDRAPDNEQPPNSDRPVAAAGPLTDHETAGATRHRPPTGVVTDHNVRRPVYYQSVARLGYQVAEALDFAHASGIVHRDIKPANIMLDSTGDAWVTDFGLARLDSDAGMTMTGDVVGTLRYMSPEQALAKRTTVDHRTDVYSLGATLYELLTLKSLFDGEDRAALLHQIAVEEPKPPR
ncbi:MAG: serine/threonine-protein kinase, partial [Pirellulales bacterium]